MRELLPKRKSQRQRHGRTDAIRLLNSIHRQVRDGDTGISGAGGKVCSVLP
jgi:hypothetical protein